MLSEALEWVATDGNAATATTEFTSDPDSLETLVDWPLMDAERWKNTQEDPDRQRRRLAEFLVHGRVPLSLIRWVATYDDNYKAQVRKLVTGSSLGVGRGNLLTSEVEALVNTVNTVGVMGKGIALQFKRAFPANFRAYQAACTRQEVQLGQVWLFDTGVLGPRRYILNFPTKDHWRSASRLSDIAAGLDSLVSLVHDHQIRSLAIPALGCGNGGLDWAEVRPLIEQACLRMPDVHAVIFAPEGAPAAASMPNATPRPSLTASRALLLTAIARYLSRAATHEAREGASELEIQKLAYFLQVLGAPLRLEFVRGTYGPYSVGLSRVLDTLEGHYLSGIGDRSAAVTDLAPVNLTPGSAEAAETALSDRPDDRQILGTLLSLVDGFETPYSLELLATVHFAATQGPVTSETEILAQRVSQWSIRKARMFTDRHIRVAARHLAQNGLLPSAPTPALAPSS